MEILIKKKRQKDLLDLLHENEIMSVSDMSKKLNTSMMTIRRDLEYLEEKGIVKKVHGGALLVKHDVNQPSFYERVEEYSDEKNRIGTAAAGLVKPGDIVFFDAGTTPLAVINNIPGDLEFTAITTGLMSAVALCNKSKANVVSIGGNIHHSSYSSTDYISVELIKKLNADLAFISTKAVSIPEGTYEAQLPLIEIKRSIVAVSKKVVLLADHSKFETKSLSLAVPLTDIDMVITDEKTSKSLINEIKNLGKDVMVV